MPRPLRVDYPGAWHHVMNRGARRAAIFRTDAECGLFLDCVAHLRERFGIEIHAYSLMPNHYHLLLRTPLGNLSAGMRYLGASYTQEVNRLAHWDGPLFRGRFRSQLVRDESYLLTVLAYIHLNPLRAGLVRRLDAHAWTSHRAYIGAETVPDWLSRDVLLALAGGEAGVARVVGELRSGRQSWPAGFDADSGHITADDEVGISFVPPAPPALLPLGKLPPEMAMQRIRELTGASGEELTAVRHGPGGNAARRFAAWALSESTLLTQTRIGQELGMSAANAAKAAARVRRSRREPLASWKARWQGKAGQPQLVSSVES